MTFQRLLAKEFSSLEDSDSDEGLSPFLFGSNLAEKIKSQTEINSFSKKTVVAPPSLTKKPRAQVLCLSQFQVLPSLLPATPGDLTKNMPWGPGFAHINCPMGRDLTWAGKLQKINIRG